MIECTDERWDIAYFGEKQSQIIISISPENKTEAIELINKSGIPFMELGVVGGAKLEIGIKESISVTTLSKNWHASIPPS